RGADGLVPQQRYTHVAQHRVTVRAVARQLPAGKLVSHGLLDHIPAVVVLQARRRPALEPHAEHQPVALQHFLDLRERFLAEVRRAQQLHLRALHQIADVMDVLGLEAVGTAHGELQLIDGTQQDRIELHLGDLGRGLLLTLQIDEYRQLILEDRTGAADRLLGVDGAVSLDVDDQLVEVGALLHARRIYGVRYAAYGRERRIELQTADRTRLLLEHCARGGRTVAPPPLHTQGHAQLTRLGQVGDYEVRVDDFDVMVGL